MVKADEVSSESAKVSPVSVSVSVVASVEFGPVAVSTSDLTSSSSYSCLKLESNLVFAFTKNIFAMVSVKSFILKL